MKQYFLQLTLFLIAIFSLTIVSCSNDDDPTEGSDKIEINGVNYKLSAVGFMGSWDENINKGEFTVSVDNVSNGVTYVDYYTFSFKSATEPIVGDDLAQMTLALTPLNDEEDGNIIDLTDSFKYDSGKAVVTNTNINESEITIRFENLKMSHAGKDYIFNGVATLMFKY